MMFAASSSRPHRPGYDKKEVDTFLDAARLRLAATESTDRPVGPLVDSAVLAGWAEWATSPTFSAGAYTATQVDNLGYSSHLPREKHTPDNS